jgi:ankyrin repeat protein
VSFYQTLTKQLQQFSIRLNNQFNVWKNREFRLIGLTFKLWVQFPLGYIVNFLIRHIATAGLNLGVNKSIKWLIKISLRFNPLMHWQNHQGKTFLHQAVELNDIEVIQFIIAANTNLDMVDHQGNTPLHYAGKNHQLGAIQLLIDAGADLKVRNCHNASALDNAAGNDQQQIIFALTSNSQQIKILAIQALLGSAANIAIKDEYQTTTLLHYAVQLENYVALNLLLNSGANVNAINSHQTTALHMAAEKGLLFFVNCLIAAGAKLELTDSFGNTALHYAAKNGRYRIVKRLIEANENPNIVNCLGAAPIHKATPKIIQYLIDAKADIHIKDNLGYTPLHNAVASEQLSAVLSLLEAGALVNEVNTLGVSPLHIAAATGNIALIKILFEAGGDIHALDKALCTPLFWAIHNHQISSTQWLIAQGAAVNHKDNQGNSSLHIAASNGQLNLVNALIHSRANIHAINCDGDTPLHIAILNANTYVYTTDNNGDFLLHMTVGKSQIDIIYALLRAGGNVQAMNLKGETPLDKVPLSSEVQVIKMLINFPNSDLINHREVSWLNYAQISSQASSKTNNLDVLAFGLRGMNNEENHQFTKLHIAAAKSDIAVIISALNYRATNINITDSLGNTPLHIAAAYGQLEIINILVAVKAKLGLQNNAGYSPLELAAMNGQVKAIQALTKGGVDLEAANYEHVTILHRAAINGELISMQSLLLAKANIHVTDHEGNTPLHFAAEFGNLLCLQRLLCVQANIDVRNNAKETPLHLAAQEGRIEIVKALIKANANREALDSRQHTPLHLAAAHCYIPVIQALIESKVNINPTNNEGNTPLHFAVLGNITMLKLLIKAGANLDAKNKLGNTPLHVAIQHQKFVIVNSLIIYGANIEQSNEQQQDPLKLAMEVGNTAIVSLLQSAAQRPRRASISPSTTVIHPCVSQSVLALNARYSAFDLEKILQTLNNWLNQLTTNEQQAILAKRYVARISKMSDRHNHCGITLQQALALVWCGLNDSAALGQTIHLNSAQLKARQSSLLPYLFELQRADELEVQRSNIIEEKPIDFAGSFNKIISVLAGRHRDITDFSINATTIGVKMADLVSQVFHQYTPEQQTEIATAWHSQQKIPKSFLKLLKNIIPRQLHNEFYAFRHLASNYEQAMQINIVELQDLQLANFPNIEAIIANQNTNINDNTELVNLVPQRDSKVFRP